MLSMSESRDAIGSARPTKGVQEQHNVLPLTSCAKRFPMLPLADRQTVPSAVLAGNGRQVSVPGVWTSCVWVDV